MSPVQDVTAGPSTATPEAPALSAVERAFSEGNDDLFFRARDAERRGEPLKPEPADSAPASDEPNTADPASAEPVEQAASTDAKAPAASETAKPKGKPGAEARIQELARENRELREKLAQAQTPKPAGPSTATETPNEQDGQTAAAAKRDVAKYRAMPGYPTLDEYDNDYEAWSEAKADFIAEKRLEEAEAKRSEREQTGEFIRTKDAMLSRGREAFDDFDDVLKAAEAAGVVFPPHASRTILTHKHGHAIAHALAQQAVADPTFAARIADPVEFGIELGSILARAEAPSKPAAPQLTKAPNPPSMLGRRSSSMDEEEAAELAGDDDRWFRARDAKRRAAER